MNKTLMIIAAAAGMALTAPAFADDTVTSESKSENKIEKDSSGNYHKKRTMSSKHTDEQGTTTSARTKVEVEADADGDEKTKVTSETVTDPKGLMNRSKTVVSDSESRKDGKTVIKHKKKVDGKTVEETTEEREHSVN